MTLIEAIERCIESSADTNQTGLTLSKSHGWRVSFQPQDREKGAVFLLNKDSLNEWNQEYEWNDSIYELAEEWIRDNLSRWLDQECCEENLTSEQVAELLLAADRMEQTQHNTNV